MRLGAAVLCCLASAACASQEHSASSRERWCGAGGGAVRGALVTVLGGAVTGNIPGAAIGIVLSPVGAVIGAVDGATKNPCPDTASTPAQSPSEARSEGPTTWQHANEGDTTAQKVMGVRYQSGEWVVQDYEQADMWFTLAANGGDREAAVFRDELEKKMTPDQIARARKLASEWKPTSTGPTAAPAVSTVPGATPSPH